MPYDRLRRPLGAFDLDVDLGERTVHLRCLRAIAHFSMGPRGQDLAGILHRAERDPALLEPALAAPTRLDALDRRQVWASYTVFSLPA